MQPQGGALGHADALGHSAPGPRRARMEFRPLDQQEYGPPMAEPGRPQTASGSPVAAQSRSGVSRESPHNRAVVPASAPRDAGHLRRRENPAADSRSHPSAPPDAAG